MANSERPNIIGSMLAMLRPPHISLGWWAIAIVITSGTNLLDFLTVPEPGTRPGGAFAIAAIIRVLLVFWLAYALLRRLADVPSPGRITGAFFRWALFSIASAGVLALAAFLAPRITGEDTRAVSTAIVMWLLITAIVMALIRLYAWQTALAVGDRTLGAGGAWRSLAPEAGALAAAYLVVAAVAAVHQLLTHLALESQGETGTLAALALIDGVVSAVQLVLGAALAVTAYRLAKARGGALREGAAVA